MNDNPRDLLIRTLQGHPTSRYPCAPLAVHYTASFAGASLREYTENVETMVDCICRYYETFMPDAVWLSSDTWVTAGAMGAPITFPSGDQPAVGTGGPVIRSRVDVDRIAPADPSFQGRHPQMIHAMVRLRERLGPDTFIIACFDQSPFSLACALAGLSNVMIKLYDDPPFVHALLDRCIEYATRYALALADAGADMLSTGDSPAGLINRDLYRRFALPAEQEVLRRIHESTTVPVSLHICGRTTHLLADMVRSGADVLEIDHLVDLDVACRIVPKTITLWGNLDPVGLLKEGTPEQVRSAATRAIEIVRRFARTRFVLSSGCTLAPETPPENLKVLFEVAERPLL